MSASSKVYVSTTSILISGIVALVLLGILVLLFNSQKTPESDLSTGDDLQDSPAHKVDTSKLGTLLHSYEMKGTGIISSVLFNSKDYDYFFVARTIGATQNSKQTMVMIDPKTQADSTFTFLVGDGSSAETVVQRSGFKGAYDLQIIADPMVSVFIDIYEKTPTGEPDYF